MSVIVVDCESCLGRQHQLSGLRWSCGMVGKVKNIFMLAEWVGVDLGVVDK